jgi:small subunit ribosomal protein S9
MSLQNSFSATGRRKEAVARVNLTPGNGKFTINGRPYEDYLCRVTLVNHAKAPLTMTDMEGKVDVEAKTSGGGIAGQAGAVRLAISRALSVMNADLRPSLRTGGYLTRDPRQVERKKYGQPKARKRFQYSKR